MSGGQNNGCSEKFQVQSILLPTVRVRNKTENILTPLLPKCRPYGSFTVATLVSVYPEK